MGSAGDTSETYKFMFTVQPFQYCAGTGNSSTTADWIDFVSLNGMTNASGQAYYTYYPNSVANLYRDSTYLLEISMNYHWDPDTTGAWIDFNQNAEFETTEFIEMGLLNASHQSFGTFTVPSDAVLGDTVMMRVRSQYWDQTPTPCGSETGEVEDYPAVIFQPECDVPGSTNTSNIGTHAAQLNWTVPTGAHHYRIRGGLAGGNNPVQIDIINPGASSKSVNGLSPGTSYQWQIQTLCNHFETLESDWSPLNVFTTDTLPHCPVPIGTNTNPITSTAASLNWTPVAGATGYTIQGRAAPGPGWPVSIQVVGGAVGTKNVFGLNPNKTYDWRIRSNCGNGNNSDWSPVVSFTTSSGARFGSDDFFDPTRQFNLHIYPNPFTTTTTIEFFNPEMLPFEFILQDLEGRIVRRTANVTGWSIEIERGGLSPGIYFIELMSAEQIFWGKVVVE